MSKGSKKTIITMLGAGQSKVGMPFIYRGMGPKCVECKYLKVCAKNLEAGRIYLVVGVRNRSFKCEAYDLEMRVVEVIEADIMAAIPLRQAIEGAILTFHPQKCGKEDCKNYTLCSPEGLVDNDRCEIVNVYDRLSCPEGFQLVRVLLRRAPPS